MRTARPGADYWPYTIAGKMKPVKVAGRFRATGGGVIHQAAANGLGIAIAPLWQVQPLIDAGRLEVVLSRFQPPTIPLHATWSGQRLPAKTRLFIDFLAARLKAERL